jgi:lipopolysaccharide heptosyltransferase I
MPDRPADPASVQRVLIVRPSALGDVARTVPALVTLRRAMPHAHIDWLVADAFADVVRHHPALTGVVPFPRRRFATAWCNPLRTAEALRWAIGLAKHHYDLAIDLQGLFRSGLFSWLTHAPTRVGFANARELAWLGYNRRHPIDPTLHTVDRMLALLEAQGYTPVRDMRLYVSPEDARFRDELLDRHGGRDAPYACLAPTARWPSKRWPLDRFIRVARQLLDTGIAGQRLVIIASEAERIGMGPMVEQLGDADPVLFPTTTVGQMMALVSHASLLVCNDSGPLHVAVAFERPIVAVFGPTDPDLVGPYRRPDCLVQHPDAQRLHGNVHKRTDQSLIAKVTVDMVWERVEAQMEERRD